MPTIDLNALSKSLTQAKARWTPRQTPHSQLSDDQKMALLGVIFSKAELDAAAAPVPISKAAPAFAPAVDWRNRNGNHVTSVKDQKNCGSCVSFCCTALVESMASIEKGQLLNLSEADAHFCSSHGASCGGWNANDCLEQIKVRGVVPDNLFPYMAAFRPRVACRMSVAPGSGELLGNHAGALDYQLNALGIPTFMVELGNGQRADPAEVALGLAGFFDVARRLGIVPGNTYAFDVFHAERHTTESNFRIETSIDCFVPVTIN